jgi:stage V sporulation protein SpoVS
LRSRGTVERRSLGASAIGTDLLLALTKARGYLVGRDLVDAWTQGALSLRGWEVLEEHQR